MSGAGGSSKGNVRRTKAWLCRTPADLAANGEFILRTRGLTETATVSSWPGKARDTAETTAEAILAAAQDDCDGRGDDTDYELVFIVEERAHQVLPLRMKCDDDRMSFEGPSVEGLIKQTMRHQEAMMRLCTEAISNAHQQMAAMSEAVTKRLVRLERERGDVLELEAESVRALAATNETDEEREARTRREQKMLELGELALRYWMTKGEAAE